MPQRLHVSGNGSTRVPNGAEFVDRVLLIRAQKGTDSNWPKEYFKHKFTRVNKMYQVKGSKSGTLIYDRLEAIVCQRGTIEFASGKVIGLKNGNVFVKTSRGNFLIVGNEPLWDIFRYPEK